jgi:hypothetical protein
MAKGGDVDFSTLQYSLTPVPRLQRFEEFIVIVKFPLYAHTCIMMLNLSLEKAIIDCYLI